MLLTGVFCPWGTFSWGEYVQGGFCPFLRNSAYESSRGILSERFCPPIYFPWGFCPAFIWIINKRERVWEIGDIALVLATSNSGLVLIVQLLIGAEALLYTSSALLMKVSVKFIHRKLRFCIKTNLSN